MTATEQAKLLQIAHENIRVYCGSRGKVTASHVLDLYESYIIWRDDLPSEIRNAGEQSLPHVIMLQYDQSFSVTALSIVTNQV